LGRLLVKRGLGGWKGREWRGEVERSSFLQAPYTPPEAQGPWPPASTLILQRGKLRLGEACHHASGEQSPVWFLEPGIFRVSRDQGCLD
jgi:hypothetical protein